MNTADGAYGPTGYRYRSNDGMEGEEGTFLLCTFWLAQALAGRVEQGKETFSRAVDFANDLVHLAEEDSKIRELLGNLPQAFSKIGLVNAACAIAEVERKLQPNKVKPESASLSRSA